MFKFVERNGKVYAEMMSLEEKFILELDAVNRELEKETLSLADRGALRDHAVVLEDWVAGWERDRENSRGRGYLGSGQFCMDRSACAQGCY